MGGNYKTTEFLKECLADSYIKLLREKPSEKITIEEIVLQAKVGRTTYFRNFSSKQELITYKLIKLWENWTQIHSVAERKKFTLENATTFFTYNYSIKNFLTLIYSRNLQNCVYAAFSQIMMPQNGINAFNVYESRFYSYGLFGLLDEWVKLDFFESVEEISAYTRKICQN